jgi:hypothetical protein
MGWVVGRGWRVCGGGLWRVGVNDGVWRREGRLDMLQASSSLQLALLPPRQRRPSCAVLAVLCYAMPCHAMPCHAMPCHAMPCYAML